MAEHSGESPQAIRILLFLNYTNNQSKEVRLLVQAVCKLRPLRAVLISRLRGVQHWEPQILHAFEPPTPPKTSVRSFGTPRNDGLLYHGVAGNPE
ncbi:hypothetical protein AB1E18_003652 [Capra hircus]